MQNNNASNIQSLQKSYEISTLKELRQIAKKHLIRKYYCLKKKDLIQSLIDTKCLKKEKAAKIIQRFWRHVKSKFANHQDLFMCTLEPPCFFHHSNNDKIYRFIPDQLLKQFEISGKFENPYTRELFSNQSLDRISKLLWAKHKVSRDIRQCKEDMMEQHKQKKEQEDFFDLAISEALRTFETICMYTFHEIENAPSLAFALYQYKEALEVLCNLDTTSAYAVIHYNYSQLLQIQKKIPRLSFRVEACRVMLQEVLSQLDI